MRSGASPAIAWDSTKSSPFGMRNRTEAFFHEKSGVTLKTPYGLEYSPHYLRTSRKQNATPAAVGPDGT